MHRRPHWALFLLLLAPIGAGCGWLDAPDEPAAAVVELPGERATEDQARAAAATFVESVEGGSEAAFVKALDFEGLTQIALADRELPDGFLEGFRSATKNTSAGIYASYRRGRTEGADYRVLGARTDEDGVVWGVVGMVFAGGGFNQVHLRTRVVDGEPRWVDIWTVADGRAMSDTIREAADEALAKAGALDPETRRTFQGVKAISTKIQARDYLGALDAYDQASPELKQLRMAHQLRLNAASMADLDNDRYSAILEAFLAAFPGDPAGRVVAVDLHSMKGEHEQAGRVLEELHADYPDAYLLVLAGGSYLAAGKPDEARTRIDKAIELDPELMEAWIQLALVASLQGDEAAVTDALAELSGKHGVTPEVFAEGPAWTTLRGTQAYGRWASAFGG